MGNSHDPSLGPFGVTAAAQRLPLFHFAVIWYLHVSGQCIACRIIFLRTLREKKKNALENVFVWVIKTG
jgi:hypothetical protein